MKTQTWVVVVLAVGIVAQWIVPAGMIHRREQALRHGVVYRFRVAPVDPYDAFRGRYVALNFADRSAPTAAMFSRHQPAYLRLETDTNGFARLAEAALQPGRTGVWMRARAAYANAGGWQAVRQGRSGVMEAVGVDLPFDRFYMDEDAAPRAEKLYREASGWRGGAATNAWLQVRVHRTLAVIEDLYLDGRPIRQVLSTPAGQTAN
jgi:uncharacterized membrane-anchored protein